MTLTLIAIGAFVATFIGGFLALKWSDKLHLVLGFSAGAIIGVAFFDLLPEALEIGGQFFEASTIMLAVAAGFIGYMLLDRIFFTHNHGEEHNDGRRGVFGAGSISFHSFLDGIAVGLAFQVSPAVGAIVAAAVLTHNFSDGINTVSMILRNGGTKKQAFKWLAADAVAPVLGITSTLFITFPDSAIGLILAVFSGFFIYLGASDLLPESHHKHPTRWTTIATVLGMTVIYFAVTISH